MEPSGLVQARKGIALPIFISLLSCSGRVNAVIFSTEKKKQDIYIYIYIYCLQVHCSQVYLKQNLHSLRVLPLFPVSYQRRRLYSSVDYSETIKHSASHDGELYSSD